MRVTRTIVVYAVVGAVVTVGVAWSIAYFVGWPVDSEISGACIAPWDETHTVLEWELLETNGQTFVLVRERTLSGMVINGTFGPAADEIPGLVAAFESLPPTWHRNALARRAIASGDPTGMQFNGWPCHCLWLDEATSDSLAIPVTGADGSERFLPLRPIPLGFAFDTAFYGLAAFTLVTGVRYTRRTVRRRRGRCVKCGHQLADEQVRCPECGM